MSTLRIKSPISCNIFSVLGSSVGLKNLLKISRRVHDPRQRSYRGFNLFDGADLALFEAMVPGEFTISGFQNRHLRARLPGKSSAQVSRLLKSLRRHELIKKIGKNYKFYLTKLGRRVIITALKLRSLYVIPALAPS